MIQKMWKPIQRFMQYLFGTPFQKLPSEFGDPVPVEWRVFEARTEEVQHRPEGNLLSPSPLAGRRR